MEREVLRYAPLVRAAKTATAVKWQPVRVEEVNERAPWVDALFEKAVGLDKPHDPSITHILQSQIPLPQVRAIQTKGLIELERALAYVGWLDFRLWWYVISPVLWPEFPEKVRVKLLGASRIRKFYSTEYKPC